MSERSNKPEPVLKLKSDKKGGRKGEKKGEHISVSRFFAIVIIILIVIALTGTGLFYFILPHINKKNELRFGAYGKEKIVFEQNSRMQLELASLARQHPDLANSPDFFSQYQLWNQAYLSAVFRTAADQIARQSGVRSPQPLVDRTIIDLGYYDDEDGNFSEAKYNETSNDMRININRLVKEQLPMTIVMNDQSTLAVPQAEKDFVGAMAGATRTFEYIPIDHNVIPDDFACNYLLMDPVKFRTISLSRIAAATAEKIESAKAALDKGTPWNDVASEYSEVKSDAEGGSLGIVRLNTLQGFLSEEQLEKLFATPEGSWTEPMETSGGHLIFKVDKAPAEADPSDPATLSDVKRHLLANETTTVLPMMDEAAARIGAQAKEDFDDAAISNGIQTVQIASTPANIGRSRLMAGFANTDAKGLLAAVSTDEKLMRSLYSEKPGFVTDPIKTGNSYIVVKVLGEKEDLSQSQTIDLFYPYLSASAGQSDFYTTIIGGDKHKSDFFNGFQKVFGDIGGGEPTPKAEAEGKTE